MLAILELMIQAKLDKPDKTDKPELERAKQR
jgi:hypothetical protein